MDLFQLFIRLIAFGVTLFMLLEFIVLCKVDTLKSILFMIATSAVVIILFILLKKYNVAKCDTCGSTIPRK